MTDPRLQEWLLRREEGDLSAAETDELADLLRNDPAARQALRLHSMMTAGIGQSLALTTSVTPVRSWRRWGVAGAAAAAVLAILFGASLFRKTEAPMLVAPVPAPHPAPLATEKPRPVPEAPKVVPAPEIPPAPQPQPPAPETPKPAPPEPRPEPREEKPAPVPLPDTDKKAPPPAPPPPARTVAVLAKLDRVIGDVVIVTDGVRSPARAAQPILSGQSLETAGAGAEAIVVYPDQTRLSLGVGARVVEFTDKRVTLGRGVFAIDLAGPFVVETPQAELRSTAASYALLTCDDDATRVDVGAGKVRVARLQDGKAIEVGAGQFANVAPGGELAAKALLRQDKKKKSKKELEFEFKVNAAIQSGVAYLKEQAAQATLTPMPDGGFPVELALWAMQRGGLPESDPVFQKLFQHMMTTDLQRTYRVSLQAMILEELDRVKYQNRIAQCAQFLVDNQAKNGQWTYGEAVPLTDMTPTPAGKPRKDVATPGKTDPKAKDKDKDSKEKPKVVQKVTVQKRRDGPDQGDNSNSQYAALGLRACFDAGVVLPQEVLKKAQGWWRNAQEATKKAEAAGWSYGEAPSPQGRSAYGSMTAGAAGSLVMYHYMLGEPWMKDDNVLRGLDWMTRHFTVTENPGLGERKGEIYGWHYYYLYALERFGIMFGTDVLGAHDWYLEGATYLLKMQQPNGSWEAKASEGFRNHDTCFAILFLRRATRPLIDVASVDNKFQK